MVQDTRPIYIHSTQKIVVSGNHTISANEVTHDFLMILPQSDIEVAVDEDYNNLAGKQGALVPANQFVIVSRGLDKGGVKLTGNATVFVSNITFVADYKYYTDITEQIDPTFIGGGGGAATNLGNVQTAIGVEVTSSTGGNTILPIATQTLAGLLSPADKVKIDNIAGTNLSEVVTANNITIQSSSGIDAIIPLATTSLSGLLSPADKTKINNIVEESIHSSQDNTKVTLELQDQSSNVLSTALVNYATDLLVGVVKKASATEAKDSANTSAYITPEQLSKYAGNTTFFASDTSVNPTTPQQPTDAEIKTAVGVDNTSRFVYYTGTDTATDPIKGVYYLDKNADIVKVVSETVGTDINSNVTASNISISSSTGTGTTLPLATQVLSGLLSPADKTKIDNIAGTDLSINTSPTTLTVVSSSGTDAVIPYSTTTDSGLITIATDPIALAGAETTKAITPAQLAKYAGGLITFVSDTSVNPAVSGEPTDAEILAQSAGVTSSFVYYTGTDTSTDTIKYLYYIDKSGTLIKVTPTFNGTDLSQTVNANNIIVSSSTGTDVTLPLATTALSGLLSPADKIKINSISGTDLDNTPSVSDVTVTSSTGLDTVLPAATQTSAGVLTAADKVKIDAGTSLGQTLSPTNVVVTSSTGANATIPLADATNAGLMSPADKALIDAGFPTNLSNNQTATKITVSSSTGADTDLPLATTSLAGLMSPADKALIDGGFPTNLSNTASPTAITVSSSTGTSTDLPLADATNAGLMPPAFFSQLSNLHASTVPSDPYGNISATNTQAALEELDDEKVQITSTAIVINVAVGDDIQSKLDEFNKYRFIGSATGILLFDAGTHTLNSPVLITHPQSGLISWQGATTLTKPSLANLDGSAVDFSVYDNSATGGTRIDCTSQITTLTVGQTLVAKDLFFNGSGTSSNGCIVQQGGFLWFTRCFMYGFNVQFYAQYLGNCRFDYCSFSHSEDNCINSWYLGMAACFSTDITYPTKRAAYLWQGAFFIFSNSQSVLASGNTFDSILAQTQAATYVNKSTLDGGRHPIYLQFNSTCYSYQSIFKNSTSYVNIYNGSHWHSASDTITTTSTRIVSLTYSSSADINTLTAGGTGTQIYTGFDSAGLEAGAHVGVTFSPAVGVVGNSNGVWR